MRLALTLDDAPTIDEPGIPFDPNRMDTIRQALLEHGVTECVAFVSGVRVKESDEPLLKAWLEAGFELGNHAHEHVHSSQLSAAQFAASVDRCDAILERAGAFRAGRKKWFRFPYLDRGADAQQRAELQQVLQTRGYAVAHASTDLCDHEFEAPITSSAVAQGPDSWRVEQRFLAAASDAIDASSRRFGDDLPALVTVAHFGPITARCIGPLLHILKAKRIELCSLESAMSHDVYRSFEGNLEASGLVGVTRLTRQQRVQRRLVRLSEKLSLWEQGRLGPLWPSRR